MIADDSRFMRTYLKNMLNDSRFHVVTEAQDGCEAIQKYKNFSPDIVLLDVTMPKVNGVEALKAIRSFDPYANVIICSALGTNTLVMEALQSGAKDFIIKPYFENLIPTMENII